MGENRFHRRSHRRAPFPIGFRSGSDFRVFRDQVKVSEKPGATSLISQSLAQMLTGGFDEEHVIDLPKQIFEIKR